MDYKGYLARLIPARGPTTTIALHLGADRVAIAAAERAIERDGHETCKPLNAESVTFETIEPAVERARRFLVRWPKARLIAGLSRRHAIVRFLELPSVEKDELRAMARLQALDGLPFSEEELLSDIRILSVDRANVRSKIQLVVVRRSALAAPLGFFERLGRYPDAFVLSDLAALDYLRWSERSMCARFLHLSVENGWMDLAAFDNGVPVASRSIPCSWSDDAAKIASEFERTLEGVQVSGKLDAVFVSRDTGKAVESRDGELSKVLGDRLGSRVEMLAQSPAGIAAIGAACADERACLDLLPPELSRSESSRRLRRDLAGAGLWLGIWLATLIGMGSARLLQAQWRLSSLDARIGKLEPLSQDDPNPSALRGTPPLELLRELSRLTPASVTIRSVSLEPDTGARIQGHAAQLSSVMELMSGLQRSPLFARAQLRDSSLRTVQGVERVDFQIHAEPRRGR